jgi:hypothetical protein
MKIQELSRVIQQFTSWSQKPPILVVMVQSGIRKPGNPLVIKETFKTTKDQCLPSCLRLVIGENDNPKFSD